MLSLTEVIHKLSVVTSTSTIFQNFPFIGIIAADRSLLPEIFLGVFLPFFFSSSQSYFKSYVSASWSSDQRTSYVFKY